MGQIGDHKEVVRKAYFDTGVMPGPACVGVFEPPPLIARWHECTAKSSCVGPPPHWLAPREPLHNSPTCVFAVSYSPGHRSTSIPYVTYWSGSTTRPNVARTSVPPLRIVRLHVRRHHGCSVKPGHGSSRACIVNAYCGPQKNSVPMGREAPLEVLEWKELMSADSVAAIT